MFRILRLTLVVGLLSVLSSSSTFGQPKPKLRPLHIALANNSVTMTAIYVAKQLGIFESYGFDARVLVLEPRAGLAALLAGECVRQGGRPPSEKPGRCKPASAVIRSRPSVR